MASFVFLMASTSFLKILNYLYHFSGNETKLGMSRGIPEPKLTAMDAMIDKLTGAIFVFQIVVVMVLGIAGNVWKDTEARKVVRDCKLLASASYLVIIIINHIFILAFYFGV